MNNFWDDNNEREKAEEELRYFYEEFSSSIRRKLISKNLIAPESVYDVLYPRTKEALLAKNVAKITDVDDIGKTIRDTLIAKLVSKNSSLEQISEDARKSLLARNKIFSDANDIINNSITIRKNILSKNVPSDADLLKDSKNFRENNISKNDINPGNEKNIERNNNSFRDSNVSKNTPGKTTIDTNSEEFRKNNISKNVDNSEFDLEKLSNNFRDENLSKNITSNSKLEEIANAQRDILESKNNSDKNNLSDASEQFRKDNLAKNVAGNSNIDNISDEFRKNNLSSNLAKESDLEKDSSNARKQNLANNNSKETDLEKISSTIREDAISKNTPKNSDLEIDSETARVNNLSSNKSNKVNLEELSDTFRKNNLSNNNAQGGDLAQDSEDFRKNNLSSNKPNNSDLLADSEAYVKNNLSANKADIGDLLTDSEEFLKKNKSANKANEGDLLNDSKGYLQNNVSANKPDSGDLEKDSKGYFENNISANKPSNSDLLSDSENFYQNNISANKPDTGDLLTDSEVYYNNNTSSNSPRVTDLSTDSQPYYELNISANSPNNTDLLTDSQPFLDGNLAANVPDTSDLLTDSQPFLNNNLAANVPDTSDLLTDSQPFLDGNLAANVPDTGDLLTDSQPFLNGNLAANVPETSDLLADSQPFLNGNLAANVPNNTDLLNDSSNILNNNLSHNVNNSLDLESYSKPFRDNNLAANPPQSSLGVNIEGIGTSTFLGISRVLTQGIVIRQVLLTKNKASKYNLDNFVNISTYDRSTSTDVKNSLIAKNEFQLGNAEYNSGNANGLTSSKIVGYFGNDVNVEIQKGFQKISEHSRTVGSSLQLNYGTNDAKDEYRTSVVPQKVGGGFFATNTVSPKGGDFLNFGNSSSVSFNSNIFAGSITEAIRNYNLSRNLYNLYKIIPGDLNSMTTLKQNNDEGFQDLLAKTIGNLRGNDSVGSQLQGNLIPRGILVANEGAYIKGGNPEDILRPQQAQGMQVGSPESMMSKTVAGNPFMDSEFQAGTKGVVHILNTIKNSSASKFSVNYDPQNTKNYIIGTNVDGTPKVARQRFTIANPYKPGNAKSIVFMLKNYATGQEFSFPPYIQNYSDSYGANWNSTNFLGRPEAVFTYNNSTREGTISFVVLTDYTQNLVIGHDYSNDSLSEVKVNPGSNLFTNNGIAFNKQKNELIENQNDAKKKETDNKIKEVNQHMNVGGSESPESDVNKQNVDDLKKQSNSITKTAQDTKINLGHEAKYSETNSTIGNVNTFMTTEPSRDMGNLDTKAGDSKKRIDEMIKNLAFQPAFFSGDKGDFLTKMDFLGKMTRPANASEGSGFSFTKPPVCHIHLGDWWNNDIIVDSINMSYDDVPWTLDTGRVQPMWATVTMNFKFVGPYRGQRGGPVLSDDNGGFYSDRK